jgi:hypothetical protein
MSKHDTTFSFHDKNKKLQCVHRRNTAEGMEVLKLQWRIYPALTIKHSTLGEPGGLGLFARKDITTDENDGILCFFFGKIIVATEEEVSFLQVFAKIK